jgi:ankyrin repeat protein
MKAAAYLLIFCLVLGCSQERALDNEVDNDIKSGTWNGSNKLESPLQSAVFHSNLTYLKRLLAEGHDIHFVDSEQGNLLHIAAHYSDLEMNMYLIQNGVNINQLDDRSWAPLNVACRYDRDEIVKLYVDNGAEFKNLPHNPVYNALKGAHEGYMEIIRILADRGFDLNDSSSDLIHSAIAYDMSEAAKLMIELGADHRRTSKKNGWNYLHWCAYYGSNDCAAYFNQFEDLKTLTPFDYKTETYIGNDDTTMLYSSKLSALDIAKINQHFETLKYLEYVSYTEPGQRNR